MTGQAGPLGTPMYRLEAFVSRWGAVTRGTIYALQTSIVGRVTYYPGMRRTGIWLQDHVATDSQRP